nr:reverse transcriptase domain-containing protein [Tanacetum cinerariifolium]
MLLDSIVTAEDQFVDVVALPKFDMSSHESTMTAKDGEESPSCCQEKRKKKKGADEGEGSCSKVKRKKTSAVQKDGSATSEHVSSLETLRAVFKHLPRTKVQVIIPGADLYLNKFAPSVGPQISSTKKADGKSGYVSALKSLIKVTIKETRDISFVWILNWKIQRCKIMSIAKGKEVMDEDLGKHFKDARRTPLTRRIIEFIGPEYKMPTNIKLYDGTTDPKDHLSRFASAANSGEWPMPVWCRMFQQTLDGSARGWFERLPHDNNNEWAELREAFVARYSVRRACFKEPHEITKIVRKANELLTTFKERWTVETGFIMGVPEVMKILSFMDSVKSPELANRFSNKVPTTVNEMMERLDDFVRSEEAYARTELPKGKDGFSALDVQALTERVIDLRLVPSGLLFHEGLATTWDFLSFLINMSEYLRFPFLSGATIGKGTALTSRDQKVQHTAPPLLVEESPSCCQEKRKKKKGADEGEGSRSKVKRKKTSAVQKDGSAASEHVYSLETLRAVDPIGPAIENPSEAAAETTESREDRSCHILPHDSASRSVHDDAGIRDDDETDSLRICWKGIFEETIEKKKR